MKLVIREKRCENIWEIVVRMYAYENEKCDTRNRYSTLQNKLPSPGDQFTFLKNPSQLEHNNRP